MRWYNPVDWYKWFQLTPFGRATPREYWDRPSELEYNEMLEKEGFVARDSDEVKRFPTIISDLDVLESYLLPTFCEFNQRSRYYQHQYYFYQWIFIIGAFLTTVVAVLATYLGRGVDVQTTVGIIRTAWTPSRIAGLFTAIIGAIVSYFAIMSNWREPRKRWVNYRRLAEELRAIYFKFLLHTRPYDSKNRIEILRRDILELKQQEESNR